MDPELESGRIRIRTSRSRSIRIRITRKSGSGPDHLKILISYPDPDLIKIPGSATMLFPNKYWWSSLSVRCTKWFIERCTHTVYSDSFFFSSFIRSFIFFYCFLLCVLENLKAWGKCVKLWIADCCLRLNWLTDWLTAGYPETSGTLLVTSGLHL